MDKTISRSVPRLDAEAKISGRALYLADIDHNEVLYARTVRSNRPHARIRKIKLPQLPEGCYAIDYRDVTGQNHMQTVVSDHPLFAVDKVEYIGQPVVLIIAPSKKSAVTLAEQVEIEYEPLPAITTLEDGLAKNDWHVDYNYTKGQPREAFEKASHIISAQYTTGRPEHLYLETNGVVAFPRDERITIYGSMQCPYFVRNAVAEATGWNTGRVQVVQSVTGGAFGGKEDYPSLLAAQAAIAALKAKRPVSLILDRKEDLEATTKRHPALIKLKAALGHSHTIEAIQIDITLDGGAFSTISPVVLQRAMFTATGVYRFPSVDVKGRVVKTHTVPSGAFRGFGAPQVLFAIEQFMSKIAAESGLPSLDLKRSYLLKRGDTTSTGGKMWDEVKLMEMIEKANTISGYSLKKKSVGKNRGIGMSLFLHGCGFTGRGEVDISGMVTLKKKGDRVSILTSNVEMGQGASTTLVKIVAYYLQIPEKQVIFEQQDTDRVPDSGPTVASRTAMIIGGLIKKACYKLQQQWNQNEAEVSEIYQHPSYVSWNNDTFRGDAYPVYSWGVNVAEVEVDPVTCEVKVDKLWGVFDIGVALDEKIIRGQMQGGMLQGLGFATLEKMTSTEGKLGQLNLTDYTIPTSVDTPPMECEFVTNPYEFGPYGAKCAGELPLSGVAPAVAEALGQALGVEVLQTPMTAEYLKKLQQDEN